MKSSEYISSQWRGDSLKFSVIIEAKRDISRPCNLWIIQVSAFVKKKTYPYGSGSFRPQRFRVISAHNHFNQWPFRPIKYYFFNSYSIFYLSVQQWSMKCSITVEHYTHFFGWQKWGWYSSLYTGTAKFCLGLQFFMKEESWTAIFKILARSMVCVCASTIQIKHSFRMAPSIYYYTDIVL